MSNPQGWIRLGIVLSAVWLLTICAIAAYEYFIAPPPDAHWFVSYVPGTKPNPEPPSPYVIWDVPSLKGGTFFQVLLLPLVVGWSVIPLIAWAVSWVRSGFRS